MKFKEHATTAVKVGNIQSNAVSIDAANLDFIITILSSGLYSNPIQSFIREIVSNAWDSHIEAGNTFQPVVLELGQTSEGQHFCKIQDFGVGLSPERFDKVYRNIGSSTKRDTNNQIGGFGIGRFSALSYSNVVRITSYHEGTEYAYLMFKENNKLSIDLLYSKPTTEVNGVAVEIDIKSWDLSAFVEAIESQLAYFDNLVVIESIPNKPHGLEDRFNSFKIKNYKNFCVNTLNSSHPTILLGKVNYPISFSDLKKHYPSQIMRNYPIALKFDIGDIGVTPNREQLLYTNESIKKIEDKLDACIQEIDDLFKAQSAKDYQDYDEFVNVLDDINKLELVSDDNKSICINSYGRNESKIFRGKEYFPDNIKEVLRHVRVYSLRKGYYQLSSKKTINAKNNYYTYLSDFLEKDNVYITDMTKVSTHGKAYIRETYPIGSRFIKPLKAIQTIKGVIKHLDSKSNIFDHNALNFVLGYYKDKYNNLPTFSNKDIPQTFIDRRKAEVRANRTASKKAENYWKQNVSLEFRNGLGSNTNKNFKLKSLNTTFKSLVVYSYKGDPNLERLWGVFKKVKFVGVAPTKMKLVKDLSNFVNINDFMNVKYKAIRNLGTVVYLQKRLPHLKSLAINPLLPQVSKRLYDVIKELNDFCNNKHKWGNVEVLEEIYDLCVEEKAFNQEILGVYKANKKELKNLEVFKLIGNLNFGYNIEEKNKLTNLITDYALCKKLFRPDLDAVKKLRKETILNLNK